MTHLGIFDIPLISNIPNIVYLSPSTKEEYIAMLDWSLSQNSHPVAIRVPSGDVVSTGHADKTDYSKLNKYKIERKRQRCCNYSSRKLYAARPPGQTGAF